MKESNGTGLYANIITLETIQQAYLIVMSSLTLLPAKGGHHSLTTYDTFLSYINAEKYRMALNFGKAFHLDLSRVFSAVAEKCVRLYKS